MSPSVSKNSPSAGTRSKTPITTHKWVAKLSTPLAECVLCDAEGEDLLTGSRDYNLYTISIFEMADSSPLSLMSKATSAKSWLWQKRLSHLNFDVEICMYMLKVSTTEPANIKEAIIDHNWIESIKDELNQFKRLDVWELTKRPADRNVIKVKWLWKNNTDAENTVIWNKSCLVSKGYSQQEGIDFEE
nr:Gag-Pol polyprotein [Tanacetum cinerariifolium]